MLPPFAGCLISITGFGGKTRKGISQLTKLYGGEYTPDMTRQCTHLLSQRPSGLKYDYAIDWGLHCVTLNWFFDSIKSGICEEEKNYYLPMRDILRQRDLVNYSPNDLSRLPVHLRTQHLARRRILGGSPGRKSRGATPPPASRSIPQIGIILYIQLILDKKFLKGVIQHLIELCDETIDKYNNAKNNILEESKSS